MNQYENRERMERPSEQASVRHAETPHEAGLREGTRPDDGRRAPSAARLAWIVGGLLLSRVGAIAGATSARPARALGLLRLGRGAFMNPWRRETRIKRRLREPEVIALLVGAASVAGVLSYYGRERRPTPGGSQGDARAAG